ncbi:MAG: hypothetical protein HYV63_01070 [Candidatus Schekmanbacteria bacterium]|nr:hypothetical protein [Candidatus Schekmanbacteria bacterium]
MSTELQPREGMMAVVRNRRAMITDVQPYDAAEHGRFHLVEVDYTDGLGQECIDAAAADRDAGIRAFAAQNGGDGWLLPETLRLADHDLGHDDRARQPQPAASALGPRFLDWQLAPTPEESWAECERHAKALLEGMPAPAVTSGPKAQAPPPPLRTPMDEEA